jgi:hypothetical protein
MTRNGFLILCGAALVGLALAVFAVLRQPSLQAADVAGEPMFPGLAERLNGLKTVTVRQADGDLTFDWDGKAWVARDRKNYPADGEKIAGLVIQMARMVKLEAKTAVADKLERLDLNDPKAKDSRAKEITLLDREGKTLAGLVVGKRKFTLGSKEGGTYVRVPGSNQAWLVLGDLNPGSKPRDWLKRDIADIKDKQVKRITVVHPDGERIVVGKLSPKDASFKIENLPAGKQPASDFVADEYGRILSVMLLDDVAKAEDVPFAKDKTTTAEIDGFDGIRVTLQTTEKDGRTWVRIKAEPPVGSPGAKEAPAKGEDKAGEFKSTAAEATPDWTKVANEINARADGWVYEVPAYEVAPLKKRMAELVKKPESKS